ncbi:MAG: hypothetical protein Q4A66_06075, partial [Eubacteriales bacterium]|nr:hypothetical protein [Eubacteriales bacterium]
SGCCASCGYQNVCTHPEEYLETEVAYEVISVNAVVDDLYHNVLVDVFEEVRCSLCGMRQECIPLELGIVEDMPHEFVDGYCSVCGHAEPEKCTHPEELMKTKVNEYSLYTGWDEEEHIAEPERAIVTMCGLCGEWIAEDVEKLPSYREPHTFDKNGQCTGCMYLQECGHESYSETYWPTDIEYLRYDEDYHYGVATLCKYACCDSCGSILKTKVVDDGYVFSQPHLFDEGICLQCGYISQKDVCYHPEELYEGVESFVVLDDPTYDETTHSYTAELYMDFYCGVCGEFMHSELTDGEVGVREDHQIDEETGKCLVCDYQIVCEHDGEVVVNYVSEMSPYNSLISYDNEKHTMYGQAYICTYCADCGMLLKKEDPGKPIYFTAEHKYERVGASYQCSECTYDPVSKTVDMHIDDWYECDHDFVDGVCTKCNLVICNHPEESIGEVVVTASETSTQPPPQPPPPPPDADDDTDSHDC